MTRNFVRLHNSISVPFAFCYRGVSSPCRNSSLFTRFLDHHSCTDPRASQDILLVYIPTFVAFYRLVVTNPSLVLRDWLLRIMRATFWSLVFIALFLASAYCTQITHPNNVYGCSGGDLRRVNILLDAIRSLANEAALMVNPMDGDQSRATVLLFHWSFGVPNNAANRQKIGRRFYRLSRETIANEGGVTIECHGCSGIRRGLDAYAVIPRQNVIRLVSLFSCLNAFLPSWVEQCSHQK